MKKYPQYLKSIGLGLAIIIAVIIYAYGFKVTKVNLEETRSPRRQEQLVRILRALAKPDLVYYEQKEFTVDTPFMAPCPTAGFTAPEPDTTKPYLKIKPSCANPGDTVKVNGFNFEPNTTGPLLFIPPSEVKLSLATIEADGKGEFSLEVKIPKRPDEAVQHIRALTRLAIGSPIISQTALDTWDKIIETVFLALLATTLGTFLAVPLSFFAAKNLMKDMSSPILSVALNLLLLPIGFVLGSQISGVIKELIEQIASLTWINLAGIIVFPVLFWLGIRWAVPQIEEIKVSLQLRLARLVVGLISIMFFIAALFMLSNLAISTGDYLESVLGSFGFLGKFFADLGDILGMVLSALIALAGAGLFASVADRIGKAISRSFSPAVVKIINIVISSAATALLFILIMGGLNLLYQFDDLAVTLWWPMGIGGAIGFALAAWLQPKDELPVGMAIYYFARTVFNALRSIEALIMVIVFVVWVGIGPFAGVLALSLHTIAALAKLYSEQVESIMEGPLEAVTATGANQLQTIVYAVIPQIIPPYISFTMYRWDINVRMSTIIGFAGGGGIGFLLIQNINLLNYRAASVQMIAIALVVASMDYLSSKMRENVI